MAMEILVCDTADIEKREDWLSLPEIIPEYRREKLAGLRMRDDRRRCIAAGLLENEAFKLYLNANSLPADTLPGAISYGEFGKPFYPEHPDFHFNISHSGSAVMCIVGDAECGCDTEKIRPLRRGVASRVLSEEESELFSRSGKSIELLFTIWTLKEAFLKCLGRGLSVSLKDFSVVDADGKPCLKQHFTDRSYEVGARINACRSEDRALYAFAYCIEKPAPEAPVCETECDIPSPPEDDCILL